MDLSEQIKNYRLQKGLSQTEFGNLLGRDRQSVARWEKDSSKITGKIRGKIIEIIGTQSVVREGEMGYQLLTSAPRSSGYHDVTKKLLIIQDIMLYEDEWMQLPEFKKLLQSLSLTQEMKSMKEELSLMRKEIAGLAKKS